MKRQVRSLLALLGFAALAMACDSSSSSRPADASTAGAGAGAAGGAGARGGAGGGGAGRHECAGWGGWWGRAGGPCRCPCRRRAEDRQRGSRRWTRTWRPRRAHHRRGWQVCPGWPLRSGLHGAVRQYAGRAAAEPEVACSGKARASVRAEQLAATSFCGGACVAWVQETGEITAAVDRYFRECSGCTFHETPGRCHPIILARPWRYPVCQALPSGEGTCVNMEFERPCPPGLKTGTPCDPDKTDYCWSSGSASSLCTCRRHERSWFCFSDPGA